MSKEATSGSAGWRGSAAKAAGVAVIKPGSITAKRPPAYVAVEAKVETNPLSPRTALGNITNLTPKKSSEDETSTASAKETPTPNAQTPVSRPKAHSTNTAEKAKPATIDVEPATKTVVADKTSQKGNTGSVIASVVVKAPPSTSGSARRVISHANKEKGQDRAEVKKPGVAEIPSRLVKPATIATKQSSVVKPVTATSLAVRYNSQRNTSDGFFADSDSLAAILDDDNGENEKPNSTTSSTLRRGSVLMDPNKMNKPAVRGMTTARNVMGSDRRSTMGPASLTETARSRLSSTTFRHDISTSKVADAIERGVKRPGTAATSAAKTTATVTSVSSKRPKTATGSVLQDAPAPTGTNSNSSSGGGVVVLEKLLKTERQKSAQTEEKLRKQITGLKGKIERMEREYRKRLQAKDECIAELQEQLGLQKRIVDPDERRIGQVEDEYCQEDCKDGEGANIADDSAVDIADVTMDVVAEEGPGEE